MEKLTPYGPKPIMSLVGFEWEGPLKGLMSIDSLHMGALKTTIDGRIRPPKGLGDNDMTPQLSWPRYEEILRLLVDGGVKFAALPELRLTGGVSQTPKGVEWIGVRAEVRLSLLN